LNHVIQVFALFMVCGLLTTLLIPETARKTLEELSGDDAYNQPAPTTQAEVEGPTEGEKEYEEGVKEVANVSPTLNA
jgi:PHS family inorganic phosphate transporter-like MFS transporter